MATGIFIRASARRLDILYICFIFYYAMIYVIQEPKALTGGLQSSFVSNFFGDTSQVLTKLSNPPESNHLRNKHIYYIYNWGPSKLRHDVPMG